MRKSVIRVLMVVMLLGLIGSSGCVVAAVGAGAATYVWFQGEAVKDYNVRVENMKEAVIDCFKDLGIQLKEQSGDQFNYKFEGATDGDTTTVTVVLESITEKVTKVKVRFGVFGDQDKSTRFFECLDENIPRSWFS